MKKGALPYSACSDAELLDLMRAGNQGAFAAIYERYFELLYLHAYNRLRNKDQARALLQDLFTHLWFERETPDLNTALSDHLDMQVRNACIGLFNLIPHFPK